MASLPFTLIGMFTFCWLLTNGTPADSQDGSHVWFFAIFLGIGGIGHLALFGLWPGRGVEIVQDDLVLSDWWNGSKEFIPIGAITAVDSFYVFGQWIVGPLWRVRWNVLVSGRLRTATVWPSFLPAAQRVELVERLSAMAHLSGDILTNSNGKMERNEEGVENTGSKSTT
ncbi:MAG: hypothetical protein HY318_11315 [Armatimonadetes bacterium]|nr:hypothetical protein [Armatimonadota bacterium]